MATKQVKAKIKKAGGKWEDFITFMFGSAYGIDKKGKPNWYDWDVDIFINKVKPRY